MKIKVCGMLQADNIRDLAELKPDFMGFIFYPGSPRYVPEILNAEKILQLPKSIIRTGVFVNSPMPEILNHAKTYDLTALQLHGDESPAFCEELLHLGFVVIKAFRVDESFNFKQLQPYEMSCDYFLFDTKTAAYGGSGKKFDWKILEAYNSDKPVFLSGGIGPEDDTAIKKLKNINIYALDLNSRFELEPGKKDIQKLKRFMDSIRKDLPKWDFYQKS